jgi:hypothetical protein
MLDTQLMGAVMDPALSPRVHDGLAPITITLFGAFFLALDRLQQLPSGDGTGVGEGVAMVDPAAVECVCCDTGRRATLSPSESPGTCNACLSQPTNL